MDLLFLYGGQPFVWDTEKASINLDKHGIAFEKACQVFFDPFVRLHDASDQGEARSAARTDRRLVDALRRSLVERERFYPHHLSAVGLGTGKKIV